ncbi:unnamed protein product [Clavelina lepadiformis]|uniref:Uncharacterized protein n=1 Tax=Clavelina lepadiformis TaxID=159417 RepID=A0ABP0FB83_CLALP
MEQSASMQHLFTNFARHNQGGKGHSSVDRLRLQNLKTTITILSNLSKEHTTRRVDNKAFADDRQQTMKPPTTLSKM